MAAQLKFKDKHKCHKCQKCGINNAVYSKLIERKIQACECGNDLEYDPRCKKKELEITLKNFGIVRKKHGLSAHV